MLIKCETLSFLPNKHRRLDYSSALWWPLTCVAGWHYYYYIIYLLYDRRNLSLTDSIRIRATSGLACCESNEHKLIPTHLPQPSCVSQSNKYINNLLSHRSVLAQRSGTSFRFSWSETFNESDEKYQISCFIEMFDVSAASFWCLEISVRVWNKLEWVWMILNQESVEGWTGEQTGGAGESSPSPLERSWGVSSPGSTGNTRPPPSSSRTDQSDLHSSSVRRFGYKMLRIRSEVSQLGRRCWSSLVQWFSTVQQYWTHFCEMFRTTGSKWELSSGKHLDSSRFHQSDDSLDSSRTSGGLNWFQKSNSVLLNSWMDFSAVLCLCFMMCFLFQQLKLHFLSLASFVCLQF